MSNHFLNLNCARSLAVDAAECDFYTGDDVRNKQSDPVALLAAGLVYGEPAFLAGVFLPFRVDVLVAALWTPDQPIPVFNLVSVGNDFCFCR